MIAARWEYETTAISERNLAAKYGMSRSAMRLWIVKQKWTKAVEFRDYTGEAGQKQFQRDVRAAIKRAYDRKIIEALEVALVLPPAGKLTNPPKLGQSLDYTSAGAWELPADPPKSSEKASPAGPARKPASPAEPGEVVRFPGAYLPPPDHAQSRHKEQSTAFPARSRTEMAAMRVQLSSLRGELALQQIQQLRQHDDLLWDYHHLLAVMLNPSKFIDTTGLDADDAARKLDDIRRMATAVVLPTEGDTLKGAIGALNKALLASFSAQRAAVGVTPRQLGVAGEAEGETPQELNMLDTASLRQVKGAMDLLKGNFQRNHEPPLPPPPEPLDDLVVPREPSPVQ